MARWNSALHPRGRGGKFRKKGGGASSGPRLNGVAPQAKSSIPASRRVAATSKPVSRSQKFQYNAIGTVGVVAGALAGAAASKGRSPTAAFAGAVLGGSAGGAVANRRLDKQLKGVKATTHYYDARKLQAAVRREDARVGY